MALPLLLGLGLLAGNELFRQKRKEAREQEITDRYAGLLGAVPGAMGPPDEAGNMGYSGGRGLLADPNDPKRQLEYAAGVMGIPRQREVGVQLLNAAMQRAQAQQESQRQAQQWAQGFGLQQQAQALQQRQFDYGVQRDDRAFTAGRDDAAEGRRRFELGYGLQLGDSRRQAQQWGMDYDLRAAAADAKADALPKLPAGYGFVPGADGGAVAAPFPGTPDHVKGTQGLAELQRIDGSIGNFLDLMAGKETRTRAGVKLRRGGVGTETHGDDAQRLSSMRGAIIASVAKMRDMGVLDKNEYERLDEQLPDPTGFTSLLKRSKSAEIAYEKLRDELRAKMAAHIEAHPWLAPPVPAGFVPDDGKSGRGRSGAGGQW